MSIFTSLPYCACVLHHSSFAQLKFSLRTETIQFNPLPNTVFAEFVKKLHLWNKKVIEKTNA